MVVNRAMSSQAMCVARLRNMVEPLYSNPQKDPLTTKALNDTQVPPPFKVSEVANEESPPTVTAATSKITDNESVRNTGTVESGGRELVHEATPVDIFDHNSLQRAGNAIPQHNTTTLDAKSSPSKSVTPSPHSAAVGTYGTSLTNSSAEEGTASEPDSESGLRREHIRTA